MPGQGLHLPRHFERTHPKTGGKRIDQFQMRKAQREKKAEDTLRSLEFCAIFQPMCITLLFACKSCPV